MTTSTLPHSLSTERAILGALLLYPAAVEQVAGRLAPGDMYAPAHQELLRAAQALAAEGAPVDLVSLEKRLTERDRLSRVGGVGAIAELGEHACLVDALPHHCRTVRDLAALRDLILAAGEISARASSGEDDADTLIREAADMVRACYRSETQATDGRQLLQAYVTECEERAAAPEEAQPLGISTGIHTLDDWLAYGGLPLGHVTIVAADTSRGKSALAQAFTRNAARAGHHTLDVTLEDHSIARTVRHLSAASGMRNKVLQQRNIRPDTWEVFRYRVGEMAQWAHRLHFLGRRQSSGKPIGGLLSDAHRIVEEHGVRLAVFDYLQLIESDRTHRKRQDHVDYVFDRIEQWAGQHPETATIVVSQMNRRDQQQRPELRNLYHSAKLEQGAHTVLLIWAPRPAGGDSFGCCWVDIAKQKDGPTGLTVLGWDGATVSWTDATEEAAEKYKAVCEGIGG